MRDKIKKFLDGDSEILELDMTPLKDIEDIILSYGYSRMAYDSNGMQVDFWFEYHNDDKHLLLEGSVYNGDFKLEKI